MKISVTIRMGVKTKAALDIFAAKEGVRQGRALTSDQAIWRLLEEVDRDAIEQVIKIETIDRNAETE
jgi:hypothetical protein